MAPTGDADLILEEGTESSFSWGKLKDLREILVPQIPMYVKPSAKST